MDAQDDFQSTAKRRLQFDDFMLYVLMRVTSTVRGDSNTRQSLTHNTALKIFSMMRNNLTERRYVALLKLLNDV